MTYFSSLRQARALEIENQHVDFFRIIRNEKDKRSIFILPSVITIKTFEGFIDRRDIVYKGI